MEKSLDDQLQAIFIDIESDAIKSAQVQEESYSLKRLLLREQDEVTLDVDKFAAETARLIMNYHFHCMRKFKYGPPRRGQ